MLEKLKRDELLAALDLFELPVVDRRGKGDLVESLESSRKAGLTAILTGLPQDRLKEICLVLGLDDSGCYSAGRLPSHQIREQALVWELSSRAHMPQLWLSAR